MTLYIFLFLLLSKLVNILLKIIFADAGRADEFYAVARSISNTDWNRFARGSLGLPESVIDDISVDHSKNVAEQKYQMIRKWEQREGMCTKTIITNDLHMMQTCCK